MSVPADRAWVPLTAPERRVLGVLVEKAKTTPDVYPLTLAALVTGCNQKSNRDPITTYDGDDVEEILHGLRKKGAALVVEGGGRVVRYKHTLYEWLKVSKVELAVMAELLLRGAQTEGDLRARAGRMEPLADLAALQAVLDSLRAKELVVTLTPPGVRRGAVVTHNLYPAQELQREQARASQGAFAAPDDAPSPASAPPSRAAAPAAPVGPPAAARAELEALRAEFAGGQAALRAEVEALRAELDRQAAELQALKDSLGG